MPMTSPSRLPDFTRCWMNTCICHSRRKVLGVEVTVEKLDLTECNEIVAVCKRGAARQRISIDELPLPSPAPQGAEWIEAYRYWRKDSR